MGTATLQWHATLPLQVNNLSEVALDAGMARPMAIPLSVRKVEYMILRYIFGYRNIRYFASTAILDIDTIHPTFLFYIAAFCNSTSTSIMYRSVNMDEYGALILTHSLSVLFCRIGRGRTEEEVDVEDPADCPVREPGHRGHLER